MKQNQTYQIANNVVPDGEEMDTQTPNVDDLEIDTLTVHQTDDNIDQTIDTSALNGLRGLVSLHIMVFHSLVYSKLEWNILGSVQMPLFFLISGYIFGLKEGKQKYVPTKCCTELKSFPDHESEDGQKHFDGKNYYQRRIARIIPLFYLTNLICIPLQFAGHGRPENNPTFITACIWTLFATTTWFGNALALNGPSWFVSTIFFFYWCFPSLLPKLQQMDNEKKQKWIWYCFWIQLIVGVILFAASSFLINDFFIAFKISTMWPPSRLPIFIMGVLAGLLRNDGLGISKKFSEYTPEQWRKASNQHGLWMIIVFVVISVVDIVMMSLYGIPTLSLLWLQLGIVWWQLLMISSLTFDKGESITYKVLTNKLSLAFGRISYAVYLVHDPLRQYIGWIVYGPISTPDCEYDESDVCNEEWDAYNDKRLIPIWSIPIVWVGSIIVAIVLNRLIEEPMRKWLRPSKK